MGLQASIEIEYSKEIYLQEFVESLLKNSFSYNDHDKITYLNNDNFEWEATGLENFNTVMDMISKRFDNNKISGIVLLCDKDVGFLLHFMPHKKK